MPSLAATDLFSLSIPERIQLVEDIWDSIAAQPQLVELSPEVRHELDMRLDEFDQHPHNQAPWDEVRSRLWQQQ